MLNLTQLEPFDALCYLPILPIESPLCIHLSQRTYLCEIHQPREEAITWERTMTSYGSGESLGILKVYRAQTEEQGSNDEMNAFKYLI